MAVHPGAILADELSARAMSGNWLALELGVPSGRITDILNGKRGISADTALRLARYFGNEAQIWLNLQLLYDLELAWQEHGRELASRVRPADAA